MSQYGAYGAARKGLTCRQILKFYYPGTKLGETGGQVKVLVSADDDRDLVVDAARGLTVRALASGKAWKPDVPGPPGGGSSPPAPAPRSPTGPRAGTSGAPSRATPSSPPAAARSRCARPTGRSPTAGRCARRSATTTG